MKVKRSKTTAAERKFMGDEPVVSRSSSASVMINAYNWFQYCYTSDDAKDFTIEYLRSINADRSLIKKISRVSADKLINVGWNCRLLYNGSQLPLDIESKVWHKIHMLASSVQNEPATKPVFLVAGHTDAHATEIIADIEDQLDLLARGKSVEITPTEYIKNRNIKPSTSKHIVDYYRPVLDEVITAHNGNEPDINYAYRGWKKRQLKKCVEFLSDVLSSVEGQAVAPVVHKPRKKRVKPPIKVVSKLKFKVEDQEFKIKSIRPTDIVGAQQLWTFSTKYRTLTVMNAAGSSGLSVKGTTVIGFDEKTSITKKLRKPESVLNEVVGGGKVSLRKLMDTIKCVPKTATGRINSDTILLRAIK